LIGWKIKSANSNHDSKPLHLFLEQTSGDESGIDSSVSLTMRSLNTFKPLDRTQSSGDDRDVSRSADIKSLQAGFRREHGVKTVHVRTEQVTTMFRRQVAWHGDVEVFDIVGHPNVRRGYGWHYADDNGEFYDVVILGVIPINSPLGAVQACIAKQARLNLSS